MRSSLCKRAFTQLWDVCFQFVLWPFGLECPNDREYTNGRIRAERQRIQRVTKHRYSRIPNTVVHCVEFFHTIFSHLLIGCHHFVSLFSHNWENDSLLIHENRSNWLFAFSYDVNFQKSILPPFDESPSAGIPSERMYCVWIFSFI